MSIEDRWLLPEGIEEVLPPQAERIEDLRRTILDLFKSWGYELVIPPLVEYLESLLTGMGHDLDLQTFKLIDQLTGRLMGLRADMTPQVARIDAHHLKRDAPTRLCYLGTVVRTRADELGGSRTPLQIGAELYGHAGLESDVEILCLMVETLGLAGVAPVYVDLSHVGIVRGLFKQAQLSPPQEALLFEILQRKAGSEMQACLQAWGVGPNLQAMLTELLDLNGDVSVLGDVHQALKKAEPAVQRTLSDLETIARLVERRVPQARVHVDPAELRGYHYHTGVMFAAYVPGQGRAIARGGRYDEIGSVFGRAKPATGFSTDLRALIVLRPEAVTSVGGIYAPWSNAPELIAEIARLRTQGERVICALPGQQGGPAEMYCDRRLELRDGHWTVVSL